MRGYIRCRIRRNDRRPGRARAAKSFARQRLIGQVVLAPFRSSTRANLRLLLLPRGAGLT